MKRLTDLKILRYELIFDSDRLEPVALEYVYGPAGERWAIRCGRSALCKEPDDLGFYHFDIEPMPSSRDANYLLSHRWIGAKEALKFWNQNRDCIIATAKEQRKRWSK